jgi:hypothetical protein
MRVAGADAGNVRYINVEGAKTQRKLTGACGSMRAGEGRGQSGGEWL